MTKVILRAATPQDVPSIRALLAAAYAPFITSIPDLPDVSDFPRETLNTSCVSIAELEALIVGVVVYSTSHPHAHLINLAVHPDAGGQGIGRLLSDHVLDAAKCAGCATLDLATHPEMDNNVALYQHLGWTILEASDRKVTMRRAL